MNSDCGTWDLSGLSAQCRYHGCAAMIDAPLWNSRSRIVTVICTATCFAEHRFVYDESDRCIGRLPPVETNSRE